MCQVGDFEYWRFDEDDAPGDVSVSVEENQAPSWTIRIHDGPGGFGTPYSAVMTAEADPEDARVVHLKAVNGRLPAGFRGKLRAALNALGFTRVRWERRDLGGLSSYSFPIAPG